jgi:oligopeptidase A
MTNPLLKQSGLPDFSHILPSHVEPAIDHLLARNRERIAELLDSIDEPTWANLIEPLDEWDDELDRAWSPVSHLNAVMNSDELRDAYNACLPKLSDYATEMGQNEALYSAYKRLADSGQGLNEAQRKVLENALRDFHLSGIDLPAEKKVRYKEISQQLSQLSSQYSDNLLDATNAWSRHFDDVSALTGLPQSALDLSAQIAEQRGQQGWMLTLDYPSFFPVMTYADDRELRREVYEAYNTRASDQGPHDRKFDNSQLMDEILALRHEQAQLLGFANYAERSLATKMADSTDKVVDFLHDLARRSKPQAEHELEELREFAAGLGLDDLQPWDVGYYAEKLRHQRYEISQEELKPYFPETRVIPGMFKVMSRLFDVSFHEVEGVESWHPDVKFYEVLDPQGHEVAQFYFDLYARPNKRGGAWMGTCQSRLVNSNRCQLPVAYMTCNFTPPVGDKPSLLTHTEVETLFHEFGHGLHHMLTRVDYPAIAGIHGVAWDAVELPSQFMENFCWQREALALFSGHYETGEPIPDQLFERMLSAKNFQSAMMMVRQLEFALFDFRIHLEYDPAKGGRIYDILNEVREQVAVIKPPAWNRFAHGFSHIFAGGYAAGYYGYKWAEVLSADAFSLFEENGIFDAQTGQSFRDNVLALGGSRDAADLFRAFRGRDPQIDALLRHTGVAA